MLMPKQAVGFKTLPLEPVHSGIFSILMTDLDGHTVGLESGGFWFPAKGELRRTNADLWNRATRQEK